MKAQFLSELDMRQIDDDTVKLLSALKYSSHILNKTIEVPVGFVTDFASVPRLPLAYLLAGGTAKIAAVIHDFLYQTHPIKSRRKADLTFLEAMKASGIPLWRREIMYAAVRVGGFGSWSSGPHRYEVLQKLKS